MTATIGNVEASVDLLQAPWSVQLATTVATAVGGVEVACYSEYLDVEMQALTESVFAEFVAIEDSQVFDGLVDEEASAARNQITEFLMRQFGIVSDSSNPSHGLRIRIAATQRERRQGVPAIPPTRDLLERWIASSDLDEVAEQLMPRLSSFPLPVYGSPPRDWQPLGRAVGGGFSVTAVGTLAESGHPVLAIVLPSSAFVCWMGAPMARIARRQLAERVARATHTKVRPEDLA